MRLVEVSRLLKHEVSGAGVSRNGGGNGHRLDDSVNAQHRRAKTRSLLLELVQRGREGFGITAQDHLASGCRLKVGDTPQIREWERLHTVDEKLRTAR